MNDWKIIWNGFCDEIETSLHQNNTEYVFEKEIAIEFFRALDWYRLNKGLIEQYQIKFATVIHRADFALFISSKETPEIIVELKRPKKKKEEKDAKQLIDYMRQKSCSYGILLLGSCLEIYYIDYSTPEHEATLVETIKYKHDSEAAHQLMDVLYRDTYDAAHMLDYCHKRVKINKSVEYWCSEDGKTEIMNMIIERSKLPDHLLETLRSTLLIEVKRKDGLSPVTAKPIEKPVTATPAKVNNPHADSPQRPPKVWMVPASPRFFDHTACFDELGIIYWKQYNNLQVDDTGYIYYSDPKRCIVYKFVIEACDMPFSEAMNVQKKFYKKPSDFESAKEYNRFYVMRKIGEYNGDELSLNKMKEHGLKRAPQGTLNLSHESFGELLAYIESKF